MLSNHRRMSHADCEYIKVADSNCFLCKIICCIVLSLMLTGCASTYKYRGESFGSQEEALAAQKSNINKITAEIKPTKNKRGGSAAFVIPSFNTFVALGVQKKGNPKQELSDYIGRTLLEEYRAMSNFLDQRKIFDKVTLIEDDYPVPLVKKIVKDYDAVIYLDLAGPNQAQWFMRSTPNYKNMPLDADKSKALGLPRLMSWLDNIEKNLDGAGYIPKK